MMKTACERVIFIIGAPHSGTTLLGMMLGTHPDALYAGEMQESRFLQDETRPLHKRTCRACGADCPIWRNIAQDEEHIYETLARVGKRSTIIDSTKKPVSWIAEQTELLTKQEINWALILLMRDPRAVVASRMREFSDGALHIHIDNWIRHINECEILVKKFPEKTVRIHYEDLATHPRETLEKGCTEINLPFEEAMLSPWDGDHHPLRGNKGTQSIAYGNADTLTESGQTYYANHPKAIVLDERWKTELDGATQNHIRDAAGEYFTVH
jgi:hypothetical protein